MKNIILYSAIISHKYGTNFYMAKSVQGLEDEIYGYVSGEWNSWFEDDVIPEDKTEAIETYFEDAIEEYVEYFEPQALSEIPN